MYMVGRRLAVPQSRLAALRDEPDQINGSMFGPSTNEVVSIDKAWPGLLARQSQTTRLARSKALLALLPLTLGPASAAEENLTLTQVVTCSFQTDNEIFSKANRALQAVRKTDDGYRIDRLVRSGNLCVENAQLKGAFGVLGAFGSLCTDDPKPLVDFAEAATGGMTQRERPPMPGLIGAYEAPKYMLVIYRGEPSFEMKPDPRSKRISYFCYYQGSGPQ